MTEKDDVLFEAPKPVKDSIWKKVSWWWYCNKESFYYGFLIIVIFGAIIISILSMAYFTESKLNTERCETMAENGHNVKIEIHKVLLPWKKCYIEVEDGKYVPYDRFGMIGYQ